MNNFLYERSINEFLRILKLIQYIKENAEQAYPIDWKYDDNILRFHPLKLKVYFETLYFYKKELKAYAKIKNSKSSVKKI